MTGDLRPPDGEPSGPGVTSSTRITTAGGGRWRPVLLAVVVVPVLIALIGAVVTGRLPDLAPGSDEPAAPDPSPSTPADEPDPGRELVRSDPVARRAFAAAVDRLEEAGTFAYEGRVTGYSPVGGAHAEITVDGEVSLPRSARQRSHGPGGGVTEEVVVGPNWWARGAPSSDLLATAPWQRIYQGPDGMGMTQLRGSSAR